MRRPKRGGEENLVPGRTLSTHTLHLGAFFFASLSVFGLFYSHLLPSKFFQIIKSNQFFELQQQQVQPENQDLSFALYRSLLLAQQPAIPTHTQLLYHHQLLAP